MLQKLTFRASALLGMEQSQHFLINRNIQSVTISANFFYRAAVFNRDDIISFLLDRGVPIDTRDAQSSTPFLDAVAAGQTKSARLLLQRGADFKACDIFMKNCVHMAVENEHLETLHMLLAERSLLLNLYSPDINEMVPLHYAAMIKDVRVSTAKKSCCNCRKRGNE